MSERYLAQLERSLQNRGNGGFVEPEQSLQDMIHDNSLSLESLSQHGRGTDKGDLPEQVDSALQRAGHVLMAYANRAYHSGTYLIYGFPLACWNATANARKFFRLNLR